MRLVGPSPLTENKFAALQDVFFQVALRGVSRLAKTAFTNICFFGAVACVLQIFPEDQKYFQYKCLK